MTDGRPRGLSRRSYGWLLVAALTMGGIGGGAVALTTHPSTSANGNDPASRRATTSAATAAVVRTDLVNTITVDGTVSYSPALTVVNQLAGASITALPPPGTTLERGKALYEVDGQPVWLFYGDRPEWRILQLGVPPGPDVAQLDANLVSLGYATTAGLPTSNTFTYATALAVQRWQRAIGQPITGLVAAGRVAYLPGAFRVIVASIPLGSPAHPGTAVLSGTGTTMVVQAQLPVAQSYLVHLGDQVTVSLPDGSTIPGGVEQIGVVAAHSAAGSSGLNNQPPGSANPTAVDSITVTLHGPPQGDLDQAPATINIVSARASQVLAVPVNALVALAGGGYAVNVVARGFEHLVAVQTGLFAGSLVQVDGNGLAPGVAVQVPAP